MGTEFKQSYASCADARKTCSIGCQKGRAGFQDQVNRIDLLEGSVEACAACVLLTAAQGSWSVARVANTFVTEVGRAKPSDATANAARETKARRRPPPMVIQGAPSEQGAKQKKRKN